MEGLNGSYPITSMDVSGTPRNSTRSRTGRSDQTAVVLRYARAAELALGLPSPGSRDPGRRRRSRPTPTTPREGVPRRTGRIRHRTGAVKDYFQKRRGAG